MYDEFNEKDYESVNLALDNTCSSTPTLVNKRRVKPRDNGVCEDKSSSVYLPEDFRDLSASLQAKIFQNFMCPSSRFEHTYIPVCSSANDDDTQMLGYLSGFGVPIHFTLLHSTLSSYSPPDLLLMGFYFSQV